MTSVFLTAEWRSLAMVNYGVASEILQPYLPRGTELDLWQGQAVVSMVGFQFLRCRVRGVPVPWHQNFEEVNLRFYVRREVAGEVRRGVVFIKEIVPRLAIALTARLFYNENYVALPMRHVVEKQKLEFSWRQRGVWERLAVETAGDPHEIASGSEAGFIFEHYWGYARQRDGGTVEYQVEHPRWNVTEVKASQFECDAAALYGRQFASALTAAPRSAFVAAGSAVQVRSGVRIA